MTEQMAKLAFEALDRLLEAYVDKSSPFHSPVSRDAQMALRELRFHFGMPQRDKIKRASLPTTSKE